MDGDPLLPISRTAHDGHTTINSLYAAHAAQDGVSFCSLDGSGGQKQLDFRGTRHSQTRAAIVALSPILASRIAISSKDQVHVYNVETGQREHSIPGIGRVITSLAWSSRDSHTLATGTINGRVSVWNLAESALPLLQLVCPKEACPCISFSSVDENVLATSHGSTLAIWSLRRPHKPLRAIDSGPARVTCLRWHPSISGRLLTVSADDVVRVWEATGSLPVIQSRSPDEDESDEEGFFGQLDGLQKATFPIAQLEMQGVTSSADWIGEHGMYVLLPLRGEIRVYSFGSDWEMLHEVWRAMVKFNPQAVIAHSIEGSTSITAVAPGHAQSYHVPSAVLDGVGGQTQHFLLRRQSGGREVARDSTRSPLRHDPVKAPDLSASMRPISIAQLRAERGSFVKTSKQLQRRRRGSSGLPKQTAFATKDEAPRSPATTASKAMTSSLELPKAREVANESLMPFLSPGIPARKPSPNTAPPIEENTDLSPLQSTSFESLPSTVGQDSDSDDETFTVGMRSSGTIMPGGVNVPLPKACGALFAPNGQLLTFFPPKPQQRSLLDGHASPERRMAHRIKARRIARLFPTFGNVTAFQDTSDDSTDDEDGKMDENDTEFLSEDDEIPKLTIYPSSFGSHLAWSAQSPLTKPVTNTHDMHKIVISVHEAEQPCRVVAHRYRSHCADGESDSTLCRHNAAVAEDAALGDTAAVLRLLAMLLEDKVPLGMPTGTDSDTDVLVVARQAPSLLRSDSGIDLVETEVHTGYHGKLRWAESPLGASWMVRRCMDWAERRADVQLLALISAVLVNAQETVSLHAATASKSLSTKLPTNGLDCVLQEMATHETSKKARSIPLLRNGSNPNSIVYDSPTKLQHCSQTSSRNPSQPPTPLLDSASSTPPLFLPSSSRQSTKLSSSGSAGTASPEFHRSSFSAAARHYAQSITEKFASYGTSPPLRKIGTSPSASELSTSLPTAGSSWSKSVSFASTASITRDSQLSKSYTTEDGDGHDSDKTIDDTSLPHTPKPGNAHLTLNLPNKDMFSDDISRGAILTLLPPDISAKALLWRAYYAEQLRCWGLWMQAAQLETVSDLANERDMSTSPHIGIIPTRPPRQRKATCSICFAVIRKLQQVCPACLHTTHIECLRDYLTGLDDSETFECPAGCGCNCDRLPYEHVQPEVEQDVLEPPLQTSQEESELYRSTPLAGTD